MPSQTKPSLFARLTTPQPRRLLLPATGLWILGLDWLLFSPSAFTLGLATPLVVVLGFLFGALGTWLLQRRYASDTRWQALWKALVAGVVVGVPWPLAGTLVGGWVLVASGVGKDKRELPQTPKKSANP
jgi:hypothetical protein